MKNILKFTGIVAVAVGLILGFADLKGWLKNKNRVKVLNWVLTSKVGMPLEDPAAIEFIEMFPPPKGEHLENLTHLTKDRMGYQSGGIINVSVNYMRKDHSRTAHVANLGGIREWSSKTLYPWIAWWLTLIGFIELLGSKFMVKKS